MFDKMSLEKNGQARRQICIPAFLSGERTKKIKKNNSKEKFEVRNKVNEDVVVRYKLSPIEYPSWLIKKKLIIDNPEKQKQSHDLTRTAGDIVSRIN